MLFAYINPIAFILIIASLVQFMEMVMKKYFKVLYESLGIFLPLITTNCAVLGAAFIIADNEFTLIKAVIYGTFSAVGITMAMIIFAGVRERIHFADPPAVFRGVPIALIAAGLLAMAFAGFHGVEIG